MGLITIALVAASDQKDFVVPFWVTLLCAIAMMLGVSIGGWRVIRTLGGRIYRLRPVHAFAAQSASALIVLGAALLGGPVSTTQVVSSAIMGVGSAERLSKVRWGVAGNIVVAWLVTIPATALVAAGLFWVVRGAMAAFVP
jgi:PiT family inorganic phosphate transporter